MGTTFTPYFSYRNLAPVKAEQESLAAEAKKGYIKNRFPRVWEWLHNNFPIPNRSDSTYIGILVVVVRPGGPLNGFNYLLLGYVLRYLAVTPLQRKKNTVCFQR